MNARLNAVENKLGIQVETRSSGNGYDIRAQEPIDLDLTSDRLLPAEAFPDYDSDAQPGASLPGPTRPV